MGRRDIPSQGRSAASAKAIAKENASVWGARCCSRDTVARSGAIVFTIRAYLTLLTELGHGESSASPACAEEPGPGGRLW
jgi:hypothetical protein